MSTVILGGGIIGLATGYYLTKSHQKPSSVHIVDSSSTLLTSASGNAGGFLAKDWFAPAVSDLGALSFRLHHELAKENDGQRRWGYGGSHVYSLSVDERGVGKGRKKQRDEDWLSEGTSRAGVARNPDADGHGVGSAAETEEMLNEDGTPAWITPQPGGTLETISGPEDCAQVEPRELCKFLIEQCTKRGVQFHLSTKATGVVQDESGVVKAVIVQSSTDEKRPEQIECKDILLAAGAWTPRVFKILFPQSKIKIPIDSLAGHSIVFKSPRYKKPFINPAKRGVGDDHLCYGIFCAPGPHWSYAPEAFARLAGHGETEIWLGGLNDSSLPLPELASDVKGMIDKDSMKELRKATIQLNGLSAEGEKLNSNDLETLREALCFRPVSKTGYPIIGKLEERHLGGNMRMSEHGGVWIASGHGPWGISLSLGTGLVISELMQGLPTSAETERLSLR